ncbi:gluconokinase [Arachidicoccus soli]|uniref:Gluconokinase n=1 Tax=Arachidicoccus soli TaxID=2341117 RepID=A0A386HL66_9BACT|nr:gluconokinase [Arachidicoccus soli]AYD46402.1 gluconokinase [Arachidicoccus soli]
MKGKCVIVMGVSGCGKSTIAKAIAKDMNATFLEGDDFHSQSNIDKMKAGIPLTDEDRRGWLESIHAKIESFTENGSDCVVSCSALKHKYRDVLRENLEHILFVYLKGSFELIHSWMEKRKHHFMPPELLKSQFDTLEEPNADEKDVITAEINKDIDDEMLNILQQLKERNFFS